jgi:ubiquinone/menaquinone biosynthesis C-methylase UbiE
MNHEDHVNLLRKGVPESDGIWADFGAGRGAFTLALTELLGPTAVIHAIDKDKRALREHAHLMSTHFPDTTVHYHTADFTTPLNLPPLDGIVAANTLHFLRHKDQTLQLWRSYLKENGRLLIVEYNIDRGNLWVPHPFSYSTWEKLAEKNGFTTTRLLIKRPSRFLGEIYSAVSW